MKKRFLALLFVAALMVSMLTGCSKSNSSTDGNKVTDAPESTPTTAASSTPTPMPTPEPLEDGSEFGEAPMLADMVASGAIPAVEERLPATADIMIEPMDTLGQYGGEIGQALGKAGWATGKPIEEGLFRFRNDGTIEPNVAKGYEVNADATEYTIYLREGMKWSDGVPFTADDCIFFYDYMCVPGTFGKTLYDCFKVSSPEGEETIASFEKIDDYTFKIKFEYSKPMFLEALAINAKWCYAPKHYHEQILPGIIGDEAAEAKAAELGYATVADMGKETGYYFWNVSGIPTLNPFVLSTEAGKNDVNGEYYEFVRNPYYWKTDSEGNQLPYVDKLTYTKISEDNPEQSKLLMLDGTIDLLKVAAADIAQMREAGVNIFEWVNSNWAEANSQIQFNLTSEDTNLRTLFNNKDFRQAVSICVDRTEYAALMSDGWLEGAQCAPYEGSQGYSDEWVNQWTEYDVDAAKTLLEGCGLVMGSDGFYDFADGSDLEIDIISYTGSGAADSYALLSKYYNAAGIKTTFRDYDKDYVNELLPANNFEAILSPVSPVGTINIALRPDTIVPVRNYAAWYGQVGNWYVTKGAEGVAPEGDLLTLCNLYDQLKLAVTEEERESISLQMLQLLQDNQWFLGYMEVSPTYWAVSARIQNFPSGLVNSDEQRELGLAHIQTFWISE